MSTDDEETVTPDPPVSDRECWQCPECHERVRPVFLTSDQRAACPTCGYYFTEP